VTQPPVVASPTPIVSVPPATIEPVPTLGSFEPPPYLPPGCGEPDPTCLSLNVRIQQDIDFAGPVPCGVDRVECLLRLDAFALDGGSDRPIVVMIPGGPLAPGNRDSLWPLARYLAGRGAVVFTADYRSAPSFGGGFPSTFTDVACAIRFARSKGAELGGDSGRVTLVAHSFGGFPASVVALSAHDYASDAQRCLADSGDGRPNAFGGVAGVYTLNRIGQDFLTGFMGGDRSLAPVAWAASDDAELVAGESRASVPVRLIVGSNDLVAPITTADDLATILTSAGRDVEVTTIADGTHDSVLRDVVTVDVLSKLAADVP
jgi:acetyl esterase/lipase